MSRQVDVVIVGAGAAGLMCAAQAGLRGRRILVIDNAKNRGEKSLFLAVVVVTSLTTMFPLKTTYVAIHIL